MKKYIYTNIDYSFDCAKWWNNKNSTYSDLNDSQIASLITNCEFEIWVIENKYKKRYFVRDEQGGNLGGIENEFFCSIQAIAERMQDSYFDDYFSYDEYDEKFYIEIEYPESEANAIRYDIHILGISDRIEPVTAKYLTDRGNKNLYIQFLDEDKNKVENFRKFLIKNDYELNKMPIDNIFQIIDKK